MIETKRHKKNFKLDTSIMALNQLKHISVEDIHYATACIKNLLKKNTYVKGFEALTR